MNQDLVKNSITYALKGAKQQTKTYPDEWGLKYICFIQEKVIGTNGHRVHVGILPESIGESFLITQENAEVFIKSNEALVLIETKSRHQELEQRIQVFKTLSHELMIECVSKEIHIPLVVMMKEIRRSQYDKKIKINISDQLSFSFITGSVFINTAQIKNPDKELLSEQFNIRYLIDAFPDSDEPVNFCFVDYFKTKALFVRVGINKYAVVMPYPRGRK